MRKYVLLVLGLFLLTLSSCKLDESYINNPESSGNIIGKDNPNTSGYMIHLNKLYRYHNLTIPDHMDYKEPDVNATGYINEKLMWYVPSDNVNNLFRLYKNYDHMASNFVDESGYSYEFPLGYVYPNELSNQGQKQIFRAYRWINGHMDHITLSAGEALPSGYILDGPLGWAWPANDEIGTIDYFSKNEITLGVSKNWGGAIVKLLYGGESYVNSYDAGRLLTSACNYYNGEGDNGYSPNHNPTEAGDIFSNGSPIINYTWNYAEGILNTSCMPLNWKPDPENKNTPILTGDIFSKQVKIQSSNRIFYEISYTSKPGSTNMQYEGITVYLNPSLFDRFAVYEYGSTGWKERNPLIIPDDRGGLIDKPTEAETGKPMYIMASNSTSTRAIALFKKSPHTRPSTNPATIAPFTFMTYYFFPGSGEESDTSYSALKLSITERHITPSYPQKYEYYVLIGTPAEIQAEAEELRLFNGKIETE